MSTTSTLTYGPPKHLSWLRVAAVQRTNLSKKIGYLDAVPRMAQRPRVGGTAHQDAGYSPRRARGWSVLENRNKLSRSEAGQISLFQFTAEAVFEGTENARSQNGSPGRIRTSDLTVNSRPLYRLSYRGAPRGQVLFANRMTAGNQARQRSAMAVWRIEA